MTIAQQLVAIISGTVTENAPLAPFSTFRIGGAAKIFVEPRTINDVVNVRKIVKENKLPFFILGNGSNMLISDDGWDGVVMNVESGLNQLSYENGVISIGAGVKMAAFVDFAIRKSQKGVEMLAGIPATLGGAIWMNAGCYGGETSEFLLDVTIIREEETLTLTKEECGFSYRHSSFLLDDIIVEARFQLDDGDAVVMRDAKVKFLKHRNEAQPVNLPNCGSVFKNPKPEFSAQLIEEAGLKGHIIGGAQISPLHANFIVNVDHAKAKDVIALMNLARRKVFEMKGIVLEPEVQLIGFKEDQILPLP